MEKIPVNRIVYFDIKKKPKGSLIKKPDSKLIGESIITIYEPSKRKFKILSFVEHDDDLIINCYDLNGARRSFYAKDCCLAKQIAVKKRYKKKVKAH